MTVNVVHFPGRIPEWTFAERIRKVRRDARQTQDEFAEALGVGVKAYAAWETGRWGPRDLVATAQTLQEVTGVPREWFLGWADKSPTPGGDDGGELPRLDSNQQPSGYRPRLLRAA